MENNTMKPILEVKDLHTYFKTDDGMVKAVNGISFTVAPGEIVGLVGESGSGKSVSSLSIMKLVPDPPGKIMDGQILFKGRDLVQMSEKEMRAIRGNDIAMIFQDPMSSLNPLLRISTQMIETLRLHQGLSKKEALETSIEMLRMVGIPEAERRIRDYPHQFSGGMRQRVMIAMALSCKPDLLICDEPTTALDVTIQAQIIDLIEDLAKKTNTAVIMITHNLGVVAGMCHRVNVMKDGKIVEFAEVDNLFENPQHPYTEALIRSIPRVDIEQTDERYIKRASAQNRTNEGLQALLSVRGLKQHFPIKHSKKVVKAINDISFDVYPGETLGLVGESGCGKSTTIRAIDMLYTPTAGEIIFDGQDLTKLSRDELFRIRQDIQVVFQDPYSSLDPRMTIRNIIAEPMVISNVRGFKNFSKNEMEREVERLMDIVEISPSFKNRYPHEFSGGQRQRIGIARALALKPKLLLLDEPVSALDVSIQAQVVSLLADLQEEFGLTYLFISHDLAVVKSLSNRVAVMYAGKIVEMNDAEALYSNPTHDYTKALLSAVPIPDPKAERQRKVICYKANVQ